MNKHTSGPWKASFTKLSEVNAENGALIAKCNKLNGLVNLQANARLIAAAPDLLEALEGLASAYSVLEGSITHQGSKYSHAMAAIAKAKGEA